MGQANSNSWVRTSTKNDGTKFQTAYRTNTVWNDDPNGIPSAGSFVTNLQVDRVAIDAGITGGGTNATWSTGATRGIGAGGIWSRTFKDTAATDLGFVLPDAGWDDLMDRSSNFQSQINNNTALSIAKAFNSKGFGLDSGLGSSAGALREMLRSQGSGNVGSEEKDGDSGIKTQKIDGGKDDPGTRKQPYNSNIPLYYPVALRNNRSQDKLKISVLKYAPRNKGENAFSLGTRSDYVERTVGEVYLPVPGGVGDQNSVSWGPDNMNPMDLALANTAFDLVENGDFETAGAEAKKTIEAAVKAPETKKALAGIFTKAAGINGNILTRKTGSVVNPNMELLFNAPTLRPFAFTYRMSPRDRSESNTVRKIIRMFKQSMSVKRTQSTLFLKSPNTYKLRWINGQSRSNDHEYLPMIKECALTGFNVSYTPDGNYATYEDSSMVSYELQFSFQELEPIYNDDYTKIDGNMDTHIGY